MDLPELDLRLFRDAATRAEFVDALRTAAHETGFFHLIGNEVPRERADALFESSREFFALPLEEKRAIRMANSPHFRGYTQVGGERTGGLVDQREQIDVGLEVDALPWAQGDPPWRRLQGPNQWPVRPAALRPAMLAWHAALQPVAIDLLRAFALSLGQRADAFDPCWRTGLPNQVVKAIRYPGQARHTQGCGAHKDSEFLTLLLQDDVGGLEVLRDGAWQPVPPREDAFVVNTGELLELASNGYYCATVHRVRAPPPDRERLSIAFFFAACLDAVVPRLPLPPPLAARARGIARDPSNPMFHEVGGNTLKGRLRSHPDVAERFYADLLHGTHRTG